MAKEVVIPTGKVNEVEEPTVTEEEVKVEQPEVEEKAITKEEAEYIRKVFFEDDEMVTLRDGKSYRIPPLSLRDGLKLMEKLNEIDTTVIILNLMDDGTGATKFDTLVEVLLMAFKPYYPEMTHDYIAEYVDLASAKEILDIMIGLNQIKKNM